MNEPPREATACVNYITEKFSDFESQLLRLGLRFVDHRMKAQSEQSDTFGNRQQSLQQRLSGGLEGGEVRHRLGKAFRTRYLRKITKFYLERDRSSFHLGPFDPLPGIAGDTGQFAAQVVGLDKVDVEGSFRTDALVGPVRFHFPVIDAAGDSPVPAARRSEMRLQLLDRPGGQVGSGQDIEPFHLCRS